MQRSGQHLRRALFFAGFAAVFFGALSATPVYSQEISAQKTLLVYYSRTGNTKIACEALQKELGCDIIEIKDLTNRKGRWGYYTAAFGSIFGTHTKIDPDTFDFAPYTTVIVGSPIWAGKPSAAIRTFIAENRFDGKRVVPVFTTNVILKETSMDRTKKLVMQSGGEIAGCFQITSTENVDGEKVQRPGQLIVDDAVGIAAEIKKALIQ